MVYRRRIMRPTPSPVPLSRVESPAAGYRAPKPCTLTSELRSSPPMSSFTPIAPAACLPRPRRGPLLPPLKPSSTACRSSRWADRLLADFHFLPPSIPSPSPPSLLSILPSPPADRSVPLPIDYYLILNAEPHFLADSIRRAFDSKLSRPPHPAFTPDALLARRQILQAACDTLSDPAARADYNRGLVADPGSTLTVPLDKVPGALCLLQEAGQAELVISSGWGLLRERLAKPVKQDLVLVMALAYVDLSRDAMAMTPPDLVGCCEVLERALKLLQEEGASNLAPDLHAQIDDTLEEITPHCILELLALPLDEEHRVKREEGLVRVRNIIWSVGGGGATAIGGGFTREGLMNEAFTRMTAAEQVELFAATPSNIPRESFEVYGVALALIAQAFVDKKPHLIKDADDLLLQLQQTRVTPLGDVSDLIKGADHEIGFALERGMCSLLVGDLDGCSSWLGIDTENSPYRDPAIIEFIIDNSNLDNENDLLPGFCMLLETWLMEEVFPRFRDTQDVHFKLRDYYDDPIVLKYLERMDGGGSSPLAAAAAIVKIGTEATLALGNAKSHALQALQKVFRYGNRRQTANSDDYDRIEETLLKTDQYDTNGDSEALGTPVSEDSDQDFTKKIKELSVIITCGSVVVGLLTLVGLKFLPRRSGLPAAKKELGSAMTADIDNLDVPVEETSLPEMPKMDAKLAEALVRKWQNIKSQALGPQHCLAQLPEVLDGRMLKIWTDRAGEIAEQGWFWEYTLLGVSIDSVTISSDGRRAMVEVTIEEAAQLTDSAHSEHNDSCSTTYSTKYEMSFLASGWKITEGAVLKSLR